MARTGSITVAALLGTGLATIGFALSGVSALGDDLQAARPITPAPVLSPGEEGGEAVKGSTPAASEALQLEDVCDHAKRHGRHGAGAPADDDVSASTPALAAKAY